MRNVVGLNTGEGIYRSYTRLNTEKNRSDYASVNKDLLTNSTLKGEDLLL